MQTALSATSGGTYALIDYVNFKGEGLSPQEAYQGQGWGLLQVLQQMSTSKDATPLQQFRRAANATNPIEREKWLGGWLNRLRTYAEPTALRRNAEAAKRLGLDSVGAVAGLADAD